MTAAAADVDDATRSVAITRRAKYKSWDAVGNQRAVAAVAVAVRADSRRRSVWRRSARCVAIAPIAHRARTANAPRDRDVDDDDSMPRVDDATTTTRRRD